MGAELVQQTDATIGVAESDEVFTQKLDPHRRAVGLGHLEGKEGRYPVAANCLAHWGAWADLGEGLIELLCYHVIPPPNSLFPYSRQLGPQLPAAEG